MSLDLVLGCGGRLTGDYLNLDIAPMVQEKNVDFKQMDCRDLSCFDNDSVGRIFSNHFLEHLSPYEGLAQFGQYHRILKENGEIDITVPDFDVMVNHFKGAPDRVEIFVNYYGLVCGGQNPPNMGGQHKTEYTITLFKKMCERFGFEIIKLENQNNVEIRLIAKKKSYRGDTLQYNPAPLWIEELRLNNEGDYYIGYVEFNKPEYSYDLSIFYRFIMIIKAGQDRSPIAFAMLPYKLNRYPLEVKRIPIYPIANNTWGECIIDFRRIPMRRQYGIMEEKALLKMRG